MIKHINYLVELLSKLNQSSKREFCEDIVKKIEKARTIERNFIKKQNRLTKLNKKVKESEHRKKKWLKKVNTYNPRHKRKFDQT